MDSEVPPYVISSVYLLKNRMKNAQHVGATQKVSHCGGGRNIAFNIGLFYLHLENWTFKIFQVYRIIQIACPILYPKMQQNYMYIFLCARSKIEFIIEKNYIIFVLSTPPSKVQ